jgi:hypothetical protein
MSSDDRLIPIYSTRGAVGAFLVYPYLYNLQGEWIGWVTPERDVFSVHGEYVGWLTAEPRILAKRTPDKSPRKLAPPSLPARIRPPATLPLSPLMRELSFGEIDVLDETPALLPTLDQGELREDMD